MTSILNTYHEVDHNRYAESRELEARLFEICPAPEQQNVVKTIANRIIVGSQGLVVVLANQTQQGKGYGVGGADSFFDKLGSQNITVSLKQEPSVELISGMREMRTNLLRVRGEFIEKVADYYLDIVDGVSTFDDIPEGFTAAQKTALQSVSAGFVANVVKTLRLVASVRKSLHQERDRDLRRKKLIDGLKTSRLLDLGFSNAKAQLDHNISVTTGYFPPEYLMDNFWQVQAAEAYFGIDKQKLSDFSMTLMRESGVEMRVSE